MVLIDTHVMIWALLADDDAPIKLEPLLKKQKTIYFSVISLVEIAIKQSIGKLPDEYSPQEMHNYFVSAGAVLLTISPKTADVLATLPRHHKDPFDRLLVAQAIQNTLPIITTDEIFNQYDVEVIIP